MIKTRNLLLIGAAVFLLSLIANAPVALLYAKLVRTPPSGGLQPSGLDGTLSEGHASSLLLNGQPLLNDLHWQLQPLSLLLLRAAFHIDSTGSALSVDGKAAKLITGGLNIDDLRATGPLKNLLLLTGDVGVPIEGQFGLKVDSARIRDGFAHSIEGEVTISSLKWTLAREPVVLGDFVAHITTAKDTITAKLEPLSGSLDVGGEVRVKTDRNYEIDVQVKAKPGAEPLVVNLVNSLGQPDAQGYFHIKSAGNLGGTPPPAAVPTGQVPGQSSPVVPS